MVGHGRSSAGSYLADPTSPIPSHCVYVFSPATFVCDMAQLAFDTLAFNVKNTLSKITTKSGTNAKKLIQNFQPILNTSLDPSPFLSLFPYTTEIDLLTSKSTERAWVRPCYTQKYTLSILQMRPSKMNVNSYKTV